MEGPEPVLLSCTGPWRWTRAVMGEELWLIRHGRELPQVLRRVLVYQIERSRACPGLSCTGRAPLAGCSKQRPLTVVDQFNRGRPKARSNRSRAAEGCGRHHHRRVPGRDNFSALCVIGAGSRCRARCGNRLFGEAVALGLIDRVPPRSDLLRAPPSGHADRASVRDRPALERVRRHELVSERRAEDHGACGGWCGQPRRRPQKTESGVLAWLLGTATRCPVPSAGNGPTGPSDRWLVAARALHAGALGVTPRALYSVPRRRPFRTCRGFQEKGCGSLGTRASRQRRRWSRLLLPPKASEGRLADSGVLEKGQSSPCVLCGALHRSHHVAMRSVGRAGLDRHRPGEAVLNLAAWSTWPRCTARASDALRGPGGEQAVPSQSAPETDSMARHLIRTLAG
ncbi:hypothetical protein Q5P01_000848 [Channa striata]|uniref:Uncharacterized protein n=1 Tax=Channa striata TaxID=64152 RepID=A0AA88IYP7_CHASR|nr:hypothetical protein Q5P01_000848 [Channa striata]